MLLAKPQQPTLKDGKHWEADKLERKKVADYLTPLVESITQPFVISLASDYGTGKTFFIECWRKDLEAVGLACVYFNAWKTDFSRDPLFAFIAAMKRELRPLKGADKKLNEAAKRAGGVAAKKLFKIGGKAVLRHILGEDGAKEALELGQITAEDLEKVIDEFAEERLRSQESAERSLDEFKSYLTEAIEDLVAEKDTPHKKIVVFVDDLDRCRPDYAISVLECIKHLFNVQGLVFILSIDHQQLSEAIKAVYGPSLDSEGYLRRFIDWNFRLPKPSVLQFINFLFQNSGLHDCFPQEQGKRDELADEFVRVFATTGSALNFSLRKIQQIFTELNLTLRALRQDDFALADRFALIACLRHVPGAQFFESPSNHSRLVDFLNRKPLNLELLTIEARRVQVSNVVHHWFCPLERIGELEAREQQIRGRLEDIFESQIHDRFADGKNKEEIHSLQAEASEIRQVKDLIKTEGTSLKQDNTTFVSFFIRRLDATAYFYGP